MRQPSLIVLPLLFVVAGCREITSPTRISQSYNLISIDERSIPDTNPVIPGVEIITTVWGSLTLRDDGFATVLTHERRIDVGRDSLEYTDSSSYPYRITGDSIEIKSPATCGDLCDQRWSGTVSTSSVALVSENFPQAPVYRYLATRNFPASKHD